MPRRRTVGLTAALLGPALAACSPGEGHWSSSTASESTPSSPTGSSTGESLEGPEQQRIDATTAREVLPSRADMPDSTWLVDISPSYQERTYDPARCGAVALNSKAASDFDDEHRVVKEASRFSQERSEGGQTLVVLVDSYDEPYPIEFFDEAGAAMPECEKFTEIFDSGSTSEVATSSIAAPTLGDRSYGVRYEYASGNNLSRLYVRSGYNRISVLLSSPKDYDERLLKQYAQDVLQELKQDS